MPELRSGNLVLPAALLLLYQQEFGTKSGNDQTDGKFKVLKDS